MVFVWYDYCFASKDLTGMTMSFLKMEMHIIVHVGFYITLQCKVIFRAKYIILCYIIMLKVCVKSTVAILFFYHGNQAHLKLGQLKLQSTIVAC